MAYKSNFFAKYKKEIIIYCVIFLSLLIFNRASIVSTIAPFGFSLAFALVLLRKNAFILAIMHFVTYFIFNISLSGFVIAISTISVLILLFLIFKILKKPINLTCTLIFACLSQAGYIYYNISSMQAIFATTLSLVIGMMFIYICYSSLGALLNRGIQSRLTLDENICLGIFIIALFSGLSGLYIFDANITSGIVMLVILCTSSVLSGHTSIYISALAGLGCALYFGSVTPIAVYVAYGLVTSCITIKKRFLAPIAIILADLCMGMFLNAYAYYSYQSLIVLLVVAIIYMSIPTKFFAYLKGFSFRYDGSLTDDFLVSGRKDILTNKLVKLSELFKQMQVAYRNLSVGELTRAEASLALSEELIKRHCSKCPQYNNCLQNEAIKNAVTRLFEFGMQKDKVSMLDANNLLTTTCVSLNAMISEVNNSLTSYFEYEKTLKNEDQGKMLIAEQLGGTADIFTELSSSCQSAQKINNLKSKELLDELTLNNIVANEIKVLEGENGVVEVIIAIRNCDVTNPLISNCLHEVFRLDFVASERRMSPLSGWSILCFQPAPRYKATIGFASSSKADVSGDTYTFTKISQAKMLFALADGMGHGKRANQISTVALSLIENFYKAGFSSQTIISSVNKILLPSNEDIFTTLDALVVDLSSATADFIKIGSSISVVKSANTSSIISCNSLPLGIVSLTKPTVQKVVLKSQDVIVLASDGVVDVFDSQEDFCNFVNNERHANVQMLAASLLEEAESRCREHKDDMTIITIKISAC